jgi:hypothetical protein
VLAASLISTWLTFFLTMAAPPRSQQLRAAKIVLALAFTWLMVEAIRHGMTTADY